VFACLACVSFIRERSLLFSWALLRLSAYKSRRIYTLKSRYVSVKSAVSICVKVSDDQRPYRTAQSTPTFPSILFPFPPSSFPHTFRPTFFLLTLSSFTLSLPTGLLLPPFRSRFLPTAFLPSFPLPHPGAHPVVHLGGLGSAGSSPASPGRARPPNGLRCTLS